MTGLLVTVALVVAGVAVALVVRRERRLTITQETIRCPLHDCAATVALRTDPIAPPRRRYVDVSACSLHPMAPVSPPSRYVTFSDLSPCEPYLDRGGAGPSRCYQVDCPKGCVTTLNAAAYPAAADVGCTAGMNDSLELVRQTQSPAITRLLWFHSA